MSNGEYIGWVGASDTTSEHNRNHFHVRQHLAHVRTGGPVKVVAVNKDKDGNYTVDVKPLVKQIDGGGTAESHGTVYGLPLHQKQVQSGAHIIVPTVGDKGWVDVGDRDHSSVLSGGDEANPGSRRMHSWSDGYYKGGFAGLNKNPKNKITQDGDKGITHDSTKGKHTFNAPQGSHDVNAKGKNSNVPTDGHTHTGDLFTGSGSWNLGKSGKTWNTGNFGSGGINSGGPISSLSDAREKIIDDTAPTLGLSFICSLRPVAYRWIVGGNDRIDAEDGSVSFKERPGKRLHWGLIAQEVKAATEKAGVADFGGWSLDDPNDPESRQQLRYDQFIAPLIKAVQELSARVVDLEKAIKV